MLLGSHGQPVGKKDSLQSLLLTAWRQRWDEQTWAVAIKQVLPRGVSGDVYDLASTMLQLATVGPSLKSIVFGYLRHSLSSALVSHGAVLAAVASFQHRSRFPCVEACLDLVVCVANQLQCRGKRHECLELAAALVKLTAWLAQLAVALVVDKPPSDVSAAKERAKVFAKLSVVLNAMVDNRFLLCLQYLAKTGEAESVANTRHALAELEAHSSLTEDAVGVAKSIRILADFRPDCSADAPSSVSSGLYEQSVGDVNVLLRTLVHVDVMCFRVRTPEALASRLLLVGRMRAIPPVQVYYNLVRTCFDALAQTHGGELNRYWVQFTYHRLSKVILNLHRASGVDQTDVKRSPPADSEGTSSWATSDDLSAALCRLVTSAGSLLDHVDALYSREGQDSFDLLLVEMSRTTALSDDGLQKVRELRGRHGRSARLRQLQPVSPQTQGSPSSNGGGGGCLGDNPMSILRAEPTVKSILSTMEVQQQQEAGVAKFSTVLFHMMGPSQHLVVGAAVGMGEVQTLMRHLIALNELRVPATSNNGGGSSESASAAKNQAIVFELSFLIVMTTVKNYGVEALPAAEAVAVGRKGGGSAAAAPFIHRWVRRHFSTGGCRTSAPAADSRDLLQLHQATLQQLLSPAAGLLSAPVAWDQLCLAMPAFVQRLVMAWRDGRLTDDQMTAFVDNLNRQHACLSVCAVAYLVGASRRCGDRMAERCLRLIKLFLAPIAREQLSASDQAHERLSLAQDLMQHMLQRPGPSESQWHQLKSSACEETRRVVSLGASVCSRDIVTLRTMIQRRGADWFVRTAIDAAFEQPFERERQGAMDAALALFHVDLQMCAVALVSRLLTDCLAVPVAGGGAADASTTAATSPLSSESRLASLARLVVSCLLMTLNDAADDGETTGGDIQRAAHMRRSAYRLSTAAGQPSDSKPGHQLRSLPGADQLDDSDEQPLWPPQQQLSTSTGFPEPLRQAVGLLAARMAAVARAPAVGASTQLCVLYVRQSLRQSRSAGQLETLLGGMTLATLWRLASIDPSAFTADMLASLVDASQLSGRQSAAQLLCRCHSLATDQAEDPALQQ